MKKRILFVDDEAMVLQGLQRSLRSMRQEWEMDFAEGGVAATVRMSQAAYDVILTDMMMPGMDGAELLHFVKEHAPRTIRLVLSGHAEQHLAMKCVGVAHQYFSKPCDPAMLRAVIGRVTAPGFALRNDRVMALVGQLEQLPTLPAMYSEIVRLLNKPDASMDEIGRLIAGDMAMTAKILQLVNSSFFGLSRRVSAPTEAAAFLGMDMLKSLVLATNVFGQFQARLPETFSAVDAALHSQRVGAAARAIAKAEKASRSVLDEAVVAGMLHDVGKLVLASSLQEEYQRLSSHSELAGCDAESAAFGANHAEVGGYLLGLWGLPLPVVEAISLHHTPAESTDKTFSALTAAHVADCLVHHPDGSTVDSSYLERLGLSDRLPAWCDAVRGFSPQPTNPCLTHE